MRLFLFILLFLCADAETIASDTKSLVESYVDKLNTSITLDKSDRLLLDTWAVEFQVKRVNITAKYRLQMTKHKEHSFKKTNANLMWKECMNLHKKEIRRSERHYYNREMECLRRTTELDNDKKRSVEQVEKEIRKWRKSYRYLVNLCDLNNPNDEEGAEDCLVELVEKDNYSQVIERLLILKLEVMGDLYLHYVNSLKALEKCLENQFSWYLGKVRAIMEVLNKCYLL